MSFHSMLYGHARNSLKLDKARKIDNQSVHQEPPASTRSTPTKTSPNTVKPSRNCENHILLPPDGGIMAWLSTAIALYGNMVTDGLVLTFIVSRRRDEILSGQAAFLIGSAAMSLISILSPVSSALLNQFGFRVIIVMGALITSCSMVSCHFFENAYFMGTMYLIGGGIGCSMIKTSSELLPSYYFCRKRVVASSLAAFGSALGIMFMPLSSLIVGTKSMDFLFVGVCFMPLAVLGLLIRPLKGTNVEILSVSDKTVSFRDFVQAGVKAEKGPSGRLVCGTHVNNAYPRVLEIIGFHRCRVILPDGAIFKQGRKGSKPKTWWWSSLIEFEVDPTAKFKGARPFYRTDIFYYGFVGHLHEFSIQDSYIDYHLFVTRAISRKDLDEEGTIKYCCCPESFRRVLATMLDFKLMSNTPYCLVMSCLSVSFIGSYVPYFYLEDRAMFVGFTENEAMGLVFYFGVGFLFSKVLSATMLILDRSINIESFIFQAMLFSGAISLLSHFIHKYYYFICYSVAVGTIAGLMPTSRLLFLYDMLSLDNLTTAVGIMYIFQGVLSFCGLAVASCLYVNFNVTVAYYYAGACDLLAASMIIPLRILHERLRNKLTAYV